MGCGKFTLIINLSRVRVVKNIPLVRVLRRLIYKVSFVSSLGHRMVTIWLTNSSNLITSSLSRVVASVLGTFIVAKITSISRLFARITFIFLSLFIISGYRKGERAFPFMDVEVLLSEKLAY